MLCVGMLHVDCHLSSFAPNLLASFFGDDRFILVFFVHNEILVLIKQSSLHMELAQRSTSKNDICMHMLTNLM